MIITMLCNKRAVCPYNKCPQPSTTSEYIIRTFQIIIPLFLYETIMLEAKLKAKDRSHPLIQKY